MSQPDVQLAPEETLDRLTGAWWILQLARGHRFNTDDVLTAWTGLGARPGCRRVLDLGAGVGSVGLMVLQELPVDACLVSLEVQRVSHDLAVRTATLNGVSERVDARLGDLRDPEALDGCGRFPLVLANPPYLPPERAVASPHPQRAAARLELHGDVFDYCNRAARHLAPEGRYVFCHSARDPRPEQAIEAAGLHLLARRDVVFRHGQPPMLAIFECGAEDLEPQGRQPLAIRGEDGRWTEAYLRVRREMRIDP
jgi:tRNA1Val (adenine37-N6)-methyltransferase